MKSRHWTPRQKKLLKLSRETKIVRIDSRTQIEVSVSITDGEARERYHMRHDFAPDAHRNQYPMRPEECIKEIPVGDIQDLEAVIESTTSEIE
jgi:hypothetical protein